MPPLPSFTAAAGAYADRQSRRRQVVIDEALGQAVTIMSERGVGALTMSEMARRMGVRGPSLYKYFASLHAVYDELFSLGQDGNARAVEQAISGLEPGMTRIRAAVRATIRWCVDNPALAQLLYWRVVWRVVPGFEPSPQTLDAGVRVMAEARDELSAAVRRHEPRCIVRRRDVHDTDRRSDRHTGPAVGARFEAVNKASRGPAWRNRPVVTVAAPGREFAFARTEKFAGTVAWRYVFAPAGDGTLVTESYRVERPVSRVGWFVIERFFGGHDRRAALRAGMEQTLQRLRDIAEAAERDTRRQEPGFSR